MSGCCYIKGNSLHHEKTTFRFHEKAPKQVKPIMQNNKKIWNEEMRNGLHKNNTQAMHL